MKKMLYSLFIGILFTTALLMNYQSQAQSNNVWTKQQASKWYNSQEWLNGLQLKPHASTDPEEFAKQYHSNKTGWDKAFAYMKETDLNNLKPGRYEIDGDNVYVIVTEAPTKDLQQTKWESHRNYNDIHYLIKGKEKIGVTPVTVATLTEAYDATKDIMFYTAEGNYHQAEPGTFFIIPPKYAHRPSVKTNENEVVKKIVIKIKTGV